MTKKTRRILIMGIPAAILLILLLLYAASGSFRLRVAFWAYSVGNFFEEIFAGGAAPAQTVAGTLVNTENARGTETHILDQVAAPGDGAPQRWLVFTPRIPVYAYASEDAAIVAFLARGKIIQAKPESGWIPIRMIIENETNNGYARVRDFEPLENASQEKALTAAIAPRGAPAASECASRFARALADLDTKTLVALAAEALGIYTSANAPPRLLLDHGDLAALSPTKRLLWLPNDEALTVALLQTRARAFLRQPLVLLETTTDCNASGLRLGLSQIGGRWYVSALYIDGSPAL